MYSGNPIYRKCSFIIHRIQSEETHSLKRPALSVVVNLCRLQKTRSAGRQQKQYDLNMEMLLLQQPQPVLSKNPDQQDDYKCRTTTTRECFFCNNRNQSYPKIQISRTTTISDGSIFMMRSFLISRMFIPSPISNIPPTLVSPRIISSVKKLPAYPASRVRAA